MLRTCVIACAVACSAAVLAQQPATQQPETWTVNFRDADISELIRFVADATGKTLIVDPLVQGTVEVVSSTPVDSTELYNLFLSILDVHNFAAIESGNVVRIMPAQAAASQAVPTFAADAASDVASPGALVTQ